MDCRELRQTSPLSQVVPPCSKATLPLIFESNSKGRFQRSLDYTINGFYKNHVTVFSEVVPVALQLSTMELIVEPQVGLPADAGKWKIKKISLHYLHHILLKGTLLYYFGCL